MANSAKIMSDEADFVDAVDTARLGTEAQRIVNHLGSRVIGQPRAISHIARSLAIYHAGLKDPMKPIASMLFAGPTGVGKTFMAAELARAKIADVPSPPLTLVQCSGYTEPHRVAQLLGSPPGYVGHTDVPVLAQRKIDAHHFWAKATPILETKYKGLAPKDSERVTGALYQKLGPYISLILFDEVEKAHDDLKKLLLHILDDGVLTLGNGDRTVFSNSIIIMTCNVGARETQNILSGKGKPMGFARDDGQEKPDDRDQKIYDVTKTEIEKTFAPEFVSRVRSEIVVFQPLSSGHQREIFDLQLADQQNKVTGANGSVPLLLRFSDDFKNRLFERSVDKLYGIRPMKDSIKKHVTAPLANALSNGDLIPGDEVMFFFENGETVLKRRSRPLPTNAPKRVYVPGQKPDK